MDFFVVAAALFLLVVVPILAIVVIVRLSSLSNAVSEIPKLIGGIYELQRRLESLDRKISALTHPTQAQAASPAVTHAQPAQRQPVVETSTPAGQPATREAAPLQVPVDAAREPATPHVPLRPPSQGSVSSTPVLPAHSPAPLQSGPPPRPPLAPIAASAYHQHSEARDVESAIAGRWFNYLGILAVALAVSFFLKYAFDNNWVGPLGRVAIGLLLGGALYPLSHWIFKRGYNYYAEGITGLGAAILYLSVWAGWHYYRVFSQSLAFPLMIAVTCVTVAVALHRNSERIALLALAGGLLTPILVSTGQNAEMALFSYLLVLGAGMLAVSWMREWKWIAPITFAATLIYFWAWYADFYSSSELGLTLAFAGLFFVLYDALPAIRSTREGKLSELEIVTVVTNALQYLIALRLILWPEYKWVLTIAVLALAAAHLMAERLLPRIDSAGNKLARALYLGMALSFATLAIPIRLEGQWITIAFAAEGLALIWSGLRERSLALRAAGLALFAIVAIRLAFLVLSGTTPETFLLNERFLTLAICAACWVAAFFLARNSDCDLGVEETQLYFAVAVAANFCFVLALSMDVWDWFGRMPSLGIDRERGQEMALSVLWVIYALGLIVAGVIRKSAAVRWQGLALLGLAIVKVFFFDLSFLTRFYRIISFFVLGLVLLAVSFFYQKRPKADLKPQS
ncbi:MAG TPA: DUF2339 domain-containing protein [Candidatus Acidoferrum sp.]|nr:DUF2339 domain-containing protein [Candidatus Acidoferrum sp.]